jgi:hypothetical protein
VPRSGSRYASRIVWASCENQQSDSLGFTTGQWRQRNKQLLIYQAPERNDVSLRKKNLSKDFVTSSK